MVAAQEPKNNPLLDAFGQKNQSLSSLYKGWEKDRLIARKIYRRIENAIKNYQKSVPPAQAQTQLPTNGMAGIGDSTQPIYDPVVIGLKDILDYDKKRVAMCFEKVQLFEEATKDWPPSGSYDQWKNDPAYITTQALCLLDPEMAFKLDAKNNSAFGDAAENGATELVKVMIDELLNYLKGLKEIESLNLKETARSYLSRKHNSKTPFLMAAEKLQLDVLKLLLEDYPYLAEMDSVKATIQKTALDPTETNQEKALDAFKLIVGKMDPNAVDNAEIWREAVKTPSLTVVSHLLKERGSEFVTYENAKIIMEKGNVDLWKEFDPNSRKDFMSKEKCYLLHTAVKWRNVGLVKHILEKFPNQIEVDAGIKDPEYAMQNLGKAGKGELSDKNSPYTTIRNALLHAMICSTSPELGIREIREILRNSSVEADTICLHLSTIDTEDQSFTEYVQWLQAQREDTGRIFKFESILKYAKFPDLNTQIPKHTQNIVADLRVDYTEIRIVFEWLKSRGVEQVLELSVPDRLLSPHSDNDVKYCVDGSKIRILKWRKLDLYLGNLQNKEYLRELHLYSSGNQSVHEQWYRELRNFENVRLSILTPAIENPAQTRLTGAHSYGNSMFMLYYKKRVDDVKVELQEKLNKINVELGYRWTKSPGRSKGVPKVSVTEFDWGTDGRGRTYRNLDEITNDVVGPNLAAFVRKFEATFNKKTTHKTKVAVIDSGVVIVGAKGKAQAQDQGQFSKVKEQISEGNEQQPGDKKQRWTNDLARQVVDGTSFVSTGDDEEQVWWHASEPHGTQMARLICSIDPFCELYIIKVAETRSSGVAANVVAEAINWAIEKEVDVISLSLVTYADTSNMSKAIQRASAKDIVILSSTADEGFKEAKDTVRTNYITANVFPIAACDRWGNLLDRSEKERDNFRFLGNNVQVGQVPFLKSPETISGSSVATAIAAGTASLILAFCRISKKCNTDRTDVRDKENMWRCQMVRKRFNEMCDVPDQKYVILENLCGKGKNLEDADFADTVDNSFKS